MLHWAILVWLERSYLIAMHSRKDEKPTTVEARAPCLLDEKNHLLASRCQHSLPCALWNTKEAKHRKINISECKMSLAAHKHTIHICLWTKMLVFLPKHSNWPPLLSSAL